MRSIDLLVNEHRAIEAALTALDSAAARIGRGGAVEHERLREIVAFLQGYADGCHHAKEEERLFPALQRHGLGPDHSMVNALIAQHEIGRVLLRDMHAALVRLGRDGRAGAEALATSVRAYVELLREHIRLEDEHFYQMASRLLSAGEDDMLVRAFQEIDRAQGIQDPALAIARFEAAAAVWTRG